MPFCSCSFLFSFVFFFYLLIGNCTLPPTWQDKIQGMWNWRKWPLPLSLLPLHSLFPFSPGLLDLFSVYERLTFSLCLDKAKIIRFYIEKKEKWRPWERGRGKSSTFQGSTVSGKYPGLPVLTGTLWTLDTALLFPLSSKRKTDVFSLRLKLFPLCSWPLEVSQWAN